MISKEKALVHSFSTNSAFAMRQAPLGTGDTLDRERRGRCPRETDIPFHGAETKSTNKIIPDPSRLVNNDRLPTSDSLLMTSVP